MQEVSLTKEKIAPAMAPTQLDVLGERTPVGQTGNTRE
jgi:hypothetical protein